MREASNTHPNSHVTAARRAERSVRPDRLLGSNHPHKVASQHCYYQEIRDSGGDGIRTRGLFDATEAL